MSEPGGVDRKAAGEDVDAGPDARSSALSHMGETGRSFLARRVQAWWLTASVLAFGGMGGLNAAAMIFWVAPEGHWMRDSWISVGLGFIGVWTLMGIGFTWFMTWINVRMVSDSRCIPDRDRPVEKRLGSSFHRSRG